MPYHPRLQNHHSAMGKGMVGTVFNAHRFREECVCPWDGGRDGTVRTLRLNSRPSFWRMNSRMQRQGSYEPPQKGGYGFHRAHHSTAFQASRDMRERGVSSSLVSPRPGFLRRKGSQACVCAWPPHFQAPRRAWPPFRSCTYFSSLSRRRGLSLLSSWRWSALPGR